MRSVAIGDLDGDLYLDIAVAVNGDLSNPGHVSVLLNEGETTGECSGCRGAIDLSGQAVGTLMPDGAVLVQQIVLHKGTVPG